MSVRVDRARRAAGGALAAALFVLAGCQGKPSSTVTGKVSYKGQPVSGGIVNFYIPEKGMGAQGELDGNGAYKLQGTIEPGTYKVYVQPPLPEQLPPGQVSKRPPFPVPKKYQDPASSTVTKEVKGGVNDITIDLPD